MQRNFWITALISFINSLSFTVLIPTIYLYGKQFGLSDIETSFLFSIYSIAQFFATPIIGKLSDRFGRKPLLIISITGTIIANLMAGFAPTAIFLFTARLLDGITGGNISVAQAIIADVTAPKDRAKGFGMIGAAFGLGFVLGPVVSLLAQQISLGASFLASSAIAAIALIVTIIFLPETLPEKVPLPKHIFDLGLKDLLLGFTIPRIGILLLVNFLIGTTFTIFTYAFQPYYIRVLNQDSKSLTILFFTFGVIGVIMQTQGIKILTKKLSTVEIMWMGIGFRSISFMLMPLFPSIIYFIVVSIIFSIFNSLVQPMISTLISLNSSAEKQGINSGLNASYLSIANGIGPVIAGLMVNSSKPITYGYPLYLAGICTLIVLFYAIFKRHNYAIQTTSQ
jgi:predicted MFS family arabinose efflux permease